MIETYAVVDASRHRRARSWPRNLSQRRQLFSKPFDNIGNKSIPDYAAYADRHIYRIGITGCAGEARVFVGQRSEGFAVNLGEVFDLINTNPVGPPNGEPQRPGRQERHHASRSKCRSPA